MASSRTTSASMRSMNASFRCPPSRTSQNRTRSSVTSQPAGQSGGATVSRSLVEVPVRNCRANDLEDPSGDAAVARATTPAGRHQRSRAIPRRYQRDRRRTTKPPPIRRGLARGASMRRRSCDGRDETRSTTPLVGWTAAARRCLRPLRPARQCIPSHGLDPWSCRESNPGPAVPMLWALRAQVLDHLGRGAPEPGSFHDPYHHKVSPSARWSRPSGSILVMSFRSPYEESGAERRSHYAARAISSLAIVVSHAFCRGHAGILGTLPRHRPDHDRNHVSPVSGAAHRRCAVVNGPRRDPVPNGVHRPASFEDTSARALPGVLGMSVR